MIAIFPEIAAAAADGQIELVSYLVRKYFGQSEKFLPSIDLVNLSHYLGIVIHHATMKEFGLLAVKDEKGKITAKIVISNQVEGLERQFLIAHLLGHFFLDVQCSLARGEWKGGGFRETCSPLPRFLQNTYESLDEPERSQEESADAFASALILPKAMLMKAQKKILDMEKLASFFSVTPALLHRRLVACGYIENPSHENFLVAEEKLRRQEVSKKNESTRGQEFPDLRKDTYHKKLPDTAEQSAESSPIEQSLKMFRELAQKLDRSVPTEK